MPDAFIAFGQSMYAKVTYQIEAHIEKVGELSVAELLTSFWTDVNGRELEGVLRTLIMQKKIEVEKVGPSTKIVRWIK